MLCKNCKKKLKEIQQGFDTFSFLSPIKMMYCENKECEEFGSVTVGGIQEEETKKNNNKII